MHQVNLSDELYQDVHRRAVAAGFANVDDYVADVLKDDFGNETPDLDHLFTPQRRAVIDAASADVRAGNHFNSEQVDDYLTQRREEWLQKRPDAK